MIFSGRRVYTLGVLNCPRWKQLKFNYEKKEFKNWYRCGNDPIITVYDCEDPSEISYDVYGTGSQCSGSVWSYNWFCKYWLMEDQ